MDIDPWNHKWKVVPDDWIQASQGYLNWCGWGVERVPKGNSNLEGPIIYQFERQSDYSFASDISLEAQSKLLRYYK